AREDGMEVTRTQHTQTCTQCEGAGEVVSNDTNPHGYGPDPQCEEGFECDACDGTGTVAVWTDPLLRLREARWNPRNRNYELTRLQAMRPSAGRLAQADMLAMAARCVTAAQALRRAA
ncbi:MAG: hypothetical protein M3Q51_03490, partial [Pseudomonadota bacterium]|nr:hypothetical protein [Pseudomonadota bacterium]